MNINKIKTEYKKFLSKHNGEDPKVVEVEIEWKDTKEKYTYIVSLDDLWLDEKAEQYRETEMGKLYEEDIFYHLGSIDGLFKLLENDEEDFTIKQVFGFY